MVRRATGARPPGRPCAKAVVRSARPSVVPTASRLIGFIGLIPFVVSSVIRLSLRHHGAWQMSRRYAPFRGWRSF